MVLLGVNYVYLCLFTGMFKQKLNKTLKTDNIVLYFYCLIYVFVAETCLNLPLRFIKIV